jgi:hypothetical protein
MEIIEEDDEEIRELMLKISRKEITICETCDVFFDYVPHVKACDECKKKKLYESRQRPEEKERLREYHQRPEVKAKDRKRKQSPEHKAKQREYNQCPERKAKVRARQQSPEYRAKAREYYQRNKKLREEE